MEREREFLLVDMEGPHSALYYLLANWQSPLRPRSRELFEIPWEEFVQPDLRRLHYAQSAFLVRFLLDSGTRRYSDAVAAMLAGGAAREEATVSLAGESQLDRGFYLWARRLAEANGVPVP